MKIFLLEDCESANNQAYRTLSAATAEALKRIDTMAKSEGERSELLKELIQSLIGSDFKSFYIEDSFWCYGIPYFEE